METGSNLTASATKSVKGLATFSGADFGDRPSYRPRYVRHLVRPKLLGQGESAIGSIAQPRIAHTRQDSFLAHLRSPHHRFRINDKPGQLRPGFGLGADMKSSTSYWQLGLVAGAVSRWFTDW